MEGLGVANLRFDYCDGFLVLNFHEFFSFFFLFAKRKRVQNIEDQKSRWIPKHSTQNLNIVIKDIHANMSKCLSVFVRENVDFGYIQPNIRGQSCCCRICSEVILNNQADFIDDSWVTLVFCTSTFWIGNLWMTRGWL